jgi:stage V sporulation protein AE
VKRKVIIVTDGDMVAKEAVEIAAKNIGGRCISLSAGNPTTISGSEIIDLVKTAAYDPVVVMVDDRGREGKGSGEKALEDLILSNEINILGLVAVASNGKDNSGSEVSFSVDKSCNTIESAVDKFGNQLENKKISGDTLSILKRYKSRIPIVVGIGDPGKMDYYDEKYKGAPVTTTALRKILELASK